MENSVYMVIVEDFREKINSGKLQPGNNIPSETSLCSEYATSRMTVRKGLSILANEGYIYSIPGKGYYVKTPEYNKYTIHYNEMSNEINSVNKTKLLGVDIIMPSDELAQKLQISKKKKVIMIRRLFYTDGEPVAYDVKYLIYQKGMPIVEKEIRTATFPEMIAKKTTLFAMKKELMIYAETPDEKIRKLLNIYDNLCLLVVEQKLYDINSKPMGIGITYYKGDYIKLKGVSQQGTYPL